MAFSHPVPERYLQLMTLTSLADKHKIYLEILHIWESGAKLLMTIRINYTANAAKPHFCQQRQRQQPWRSSRAMAIQLCTKTASQRMPKVSWLVIYTSDHVTFTNIGILGNLFIELVRHEFPSNWNHLKPWEISAVCIQLFKLGTGVPLALLLAPVSPGWKRERTREWRGCTKWLPFFWVPARMRL